MYNYNNNYYYATIDQQWSTHCVAICVFVLHKVLLMIDIIILPIIILIDYLTAAGPYLSSLSNWSAVRVPSMDSQFSLNTE